MMTVKDLFRRAFSRILPETEVEVGGQYIGDQISERVAEMVAKLEADGLGEECEFERFVKMDNGSWLASGSVRGAPKVRNRFGPFSQA